MGAAGRLARALIVRFDPKVHDVSQFASTASSLDRWLRHSADQSQRRDAARTFVAVSAEQRVLGYYAALVGEVAHARASPAVAQGMSRHYPIPVALIARLAVDGAAQGRGIGAALLRDALARSLAASEHVAIRAVVVHAVDDGAATFSARHGFASLADEPRTLMVTLAAIRASRA